MLRHRDLSINRRRFMQFVAGSPLLAGVSGTALAQVLLPRTSSPIRSRGHRRIRRG